MRKMITAVIAAASLVGGLTVASAADAQSRYYRHRDNDAEVAIAAGLAGLALGAAISNRGYGYSYGGRGYGYPSYGYSRPYYGGYYGRPAYRPYNRGYYGRPYAPRYRQTCTYWRHDRWGRAYPVQRRC